MTKYQEICNCITETLKEYNDFKESCAKIFSSILEEFPSFIGVDSSKFNMYGMSSESKLVQLSKTNETKSWMFLDKGGYSVVYQLILEEKSLVIEIPIVITILKQDLRIIIGSKNLKYYESEDIKTVLDCIYSCIIDYIIRRPQLYYNQRVDSTPNWNIDHE